MEVINFWLSFFGNITSIIGFGLTIAIWYGVKSLKSFYVAKATIPHQLKELGELRENIEELLSGKFDTPNRDKALEFSSAANVNIQNFDLAPIKWTQKMSESIRLGRTGARSWTKRKRSIGSIQKSLN